MNEAIIISLITFVLGPIIVYGTKKIIDNLLKKKTNIQDYIEESEVIVQKLDEIREEFGFERAWIAQFHNGGHFYPTGKSIQKFSIFYESLSNNISSVKMLFQNIPVSLFAKALKFVLNNDYLSITDFTKTSDDAYGLKASAEETDTKSMYMIAIKSIDNRFIALFNGSNTKQRKPLTQEQINDLRVKISVLGGVISTALQSKK
jgi:p-aminobenzoyl-glutamate transporter AbgT